MFGCTSVRPPARSQTLTTKKYRANANGIVVCFYARLLLQPWYLWELRVYFASKNNKKRKKERKKVMMRWQKARMRQEQRNKFTKTKTCRKRSQRTRRTRKRSRNENRKRTVFPTQYTYFTLFAILANFPFYPPTPSNEIRCCCCSAKYWWTKKKKNRNTCEREKQSEWVSVSVGVSMCGGCVESIFLGAHIHSYSRTRTIK